MVCRFAPFAFIFLPIWPSLVAIPAAVAIVAIVAIEVAANARLEVAQILDRPIVLRANIVDRVRESLLLFGHVFDHVDERIELLVERVLLPFRRLLHGEATATRCLLEMLPRIVEMLRIVDQRPIVGKPLQPCSSM